MPGCRVNRRKPLRVMLNERVRGTRHHGGAGMAIRGGMTPRERRKFWVMLGRPLGPVWNDQKVEKGQCRDTVKSVSTC